MQRFVRVDFLPIEGEHTDQQLVEHDTERVHVSARIDVFPAQLGLFGAHVAYGSDDGTHLRIHGFQIQTPRNAFGDAEVDDLGQGPSVHFRDQDVGGFQVSVDHRFLMGVLDTVADELEESSRSTSPSLFRSQYSVMGQPSTYSMTRYGCPAGVAPASNILAMVG